MLFMMMMVLVMIMAHDGYDGNGDGYDDGEDDKDDNESLSIYFLILTNQNYILYTNRTFHTYFSNKSH